ncbi:hypothetical protein J6E39_01145 [bacterium]|nr:hypothetical protein [bacterium]
MKKILSVFCFCMVVLAIGISQAQAAPELNPAVSENDCLENFKNYRAQIYKSIKLNDEQLIYIKTLDEKFYEEAAPEFMKISRYVIQINDIANSENCSIQEIKAIRKEFDRSSDEISKYKKNYEKNFKKVLNSEQKISYTKSKKQIRAQLKKEIKDFKKFQKEKIKNSKV